MAGIGFTLRKLTQQDNLLGMVKGYALSSVVSMGPWLFTIAALTGFNIIGGRLGDQAVVAEFRAVLIYNFGFSLVLSGPVLMIVTRYLADRIFERRLEDCWGTFVAALALMLVGQLAAVIPFYGFYLRLESSVRLLAMVNFLLISGIWLAMVFLSSIKDYGKVSAAFLIGLLLGVVLATMLLRYQVAGILLGFNIGLTVVLFTMVAAIMAAFPFPMTSPLRFLTYFRAYWDLVLIGIVYNSAIWVDKWIMWSAPEALRMDSGLVTNPIYDSATFLAYLTVVPAMSTFVIDIETAFFERYRRFYRDIKEHACHATIRTNLRDMSGLVLEKLRNLILLQGTAAIVAILAAPRLFELFGIDFLQIGVFRLSVLGAFFHMILLSASIVLAYFDLRRMVLALNLTFLALNAGLTAITVHFGFRFYGYGYFLACLLSAVLACGLGAYALSRLPYLAFIRTNKSIH